MSDLGYPRQLLDIGDKQGAIKELTHILQTEPKNIEAWLVLAQAMDDLERKADCYRQVIRLEPGNVAAQEELRKLVNAVQEKPVHVAPPQPVSMNTVKPPATADRPSPPSQKPIKRSPRTASFARKMGLSSKEWRILTRTVLAVIGLISVFSGFAIIKTIEYNVQATRTAIAAAATASSHLNCRLKFEDDMTEIFSRFFRQQGIADVTARINLPEQISHLEEIRTEAWTMKSKSCEPRLHARFMDYLDKSINSYIAFSADDIHVEDKYLESLKALVSLDDAVIAEGHPGGLLELFRDRDYYYWDKLDDPNWKKGISG